MPAEQAWSLMRPLTSNKRMVRERFIQILTDLQGYDVRHQLINSSTSRWIDQHWTLDHLNVLEKKIYERSVEFLSYSCYSCLVLDDKTIGSKAMDVETKPVSNSY